MIIKTKITGDGVEQHVAEAFEKGRDAAHPGGPNSNSVLK